MVQRKNVVPVTQEGGERGEDEREEEEAACGPQLGDVHHVFWKLGAPSSSRGWALTMSLGCELFSL